MSTEPYEQIHLLAEQLAEQPPLPETVRVSPDVLDKIRGGSEWPGQVPGRFAPPPWFGLRVIEDDTLPPNGWEVRNAAGDIVHESVAAAAARVERLIAEKLAALPIRLVPVYETTIEPGTRGVDSVQATTTVRLRPPN